LLLSYKNLYFAAIYRPNAMNKYLWVMIAGLTLSGLISCSNGGENAHGDSLTTDMVKNPITADGSSDTTELPRFQFTETNHDFGVIVEGEKVSYTYKFKNAGKSELIISAAKGSCGCTVPKYSTTPVPPGGSGEIEVIFDSSGRSGMQHKTVTVLANTQPNRIELTFTAEIVVPEDKK
jgi:hypothetical protein